MQVKILIVICILLATLAIYSFSHYEATSSVKGSISIAEKEPVNLVFDTGSKHEDYTVKNLIIIVSRGFGFDDLMLARTTLVGTSSKLAVDQMPVTGLLMPTSISQTEQRPGVSISAITSGDTVEPGSVGLTEQGKQLRSLFDIVRDLRFARGIVSKGQLVDVYASGFVTHLQDERYFQEAARQLVNENNIELLIGKGLEHFTNSATENGETLLDVASQQGYQVFTNRQIVFQKFSEKVLGLFPDVQSQRVGELPVLLDLSTLALKHLQTVAETRKSGMLLVIDTGNASVENNQIESIVKHYREIDDVVSSALLFANTYKETLVLVVSDADCSQYKLVDGNEHIAKWQKKVISGCEPNMIPLYAYGTKSELFTGTMRHTELYYKLAEALGF